MRCRRLESTDQAYERLAAIPLTQFEPYILSNLTEYRRRSSSSTPSESFLKFVDKVLLESSPDTLPQVLQAVARQPEIQKRQSLIDAVTKLASSDPFYDQKQCDLDRLAVMAAVDRFTVLFEPCLDLLKSKIELRQTVREQASKRLDSQEAAPIASYCCWRSMLMPNSIKLRRSLSSSNC